MYRVTRANVHWLAEGDKNTKFFHQRASNRRRRNQIDRVIGPNGEVVDKTEDIARVAVDLFSVLFSSGQPS